MVPWADGLLTAGMPKLLPCRSLGGVRAVHCLQGSVHCLQGYHSSDWEQFWLKNVDTLQQGACEAMKQDVDLGRCWVQQVTERECLALSGLCTDLGHLSPLKPGSPIC